MDTTHQYQQPQPGDIICIAGKLGQHTATPDAEAHYLAQSNCVHAITDIQDGIDTGIKRIMERNGVSAEIQLEDLPLGNTLTQQYGSQLSKLYQIALHDGHFFELIAAVHHAHFADLNAEYTRRFGITLHAIGHIVEGCATKVNYIENAFGAMPYGSLWEHFADNNV